MATIQEALMIAVKHHQEGRLHEAEKIYRDILRVEPRHSDSLHLLGVIAHQTGNHGIAIELIGHAIASRPGDAVYHIHQADSTRKLPGYGHTDFKSGFAALKKIGFDKYMALECGIPGDPEVELPKAVQYLKSCM